MSRFLSQKYLALKPYAPGEQPQDRRYIKLNTNESPYPPAPGVIDAVNADAARDLRLYSDPDLFALRQAIADRYGLAPDEVLPTNGSDEALAFAFQAYGGAERRMCYPAISYSFYPVLSALYGVNAEAIPLKDDFSIDVNDYTGIGRDVVIANPNAPTGLALPRADIEKILRSNPDNVVLVDEAYVDFGGESCVPLIGKYENLIVVMTCSKSYNLAGARLGFIMAGRDLIADMNRIKFSFHPYNVNRLTTAIGIAAMRDAPYYAECVSRIVETRGYVKKALEGMGFSVLDSRANFLFVRPRGMRGGAYYEALRARGVLVRHFSQGDIADWTRVTIGSREEMDIFLKETEAICHA